MRRRPRIGLCAALERARWTVWDREAFLLSRAYVDALQRAGAIALMLPPDAWVAEHPDDVLDGLDGLMLAGGADIDPGRLRRAPPPEDDEHAPGARPRRDRAGAARRCERDLPRARHLPRDAAAQRRARRHAGPAPARRRRPHRPPPLARLLRQRRPRRAAGAGLARGAGVRGAACTRPSRTTTRRSTGSATAWWRAGWSVLDELVEAIELPDRALGARRPVAPGGRPALARACGGVRGRQRGARTPGVDALTAGDRRERQQASRRLPVTGRVRRAAPRYIRAPSVRRSTAIRAAACTVLAAGVAAPLAPPPAAPQAARGDRRGGARRRSRWPCSSRARARATSACARCRCGPTWRRTRCPTTTPRRSSGACASPTRSRSTAASASARRRRCACSARSARPGGFARWEKLLVWSHWLWFAFPHGTVALRAVPPPRPLPARRRADLRDVRHRRDRLLGDPDRAAVVRRRSRG